jgi:hypothetical protein
MVHLFITDRGNFTVFHYDHQIHSTVLLPHIFIYHKIRGSHHDSNIFTDSETIQNGTKKTMYSSMPHTILCTHIETTTSNSNHFKIDTQHNTFI